MNPSANIPSIEIHVPNVESEQEFLLLVVQAAVKKYRERHDRAIPSQATSAEDHVLPQRVE